MSPSPHAGALTRHVVAAAAVPGATAPGATAADPRPSPPTATFEQIYDAWIVSVLRWLRANGVADWESEDLSQEVFMVVQRKLSSFEEGNFAGWLYGIVKRVARDHRRRAWFRNLVQQRGDLQLDEIPNPGNSPAASLATRERYRLMWRILAKMSESQRSAFVLFEVEGYTGEEIAELEGIPVKTVWSRLQAARHEFTRLRLQMEAIDGMKGAP